MAEVTVRELIEALQKLPQKAEVYISEPVEDALNRDTEPDPEFEAHEEYCQADGTKYYPHGRVRL